MASGATLIWGTIIYIILGAIACVVTKITGKAGYHRYATMSIPLIITATFCLWLMWFCAWLMQWHPLIIPEYKEFH